MMPACLVRLSSPAKRSRAGVRMPADMKTAEEGSSECLKLAGEEGFEPSLADSESAVLPLDDSPAQKDYSTGKNLSQ